MQIKPLKKLGQNFLANMGIVKKIIASAELKPDDVILEIGPGLGVLTKGIAEKTKRVIAVEKDKRLCGILKEKFKNHKNVEIINEDILNFQPDLKKYKIIANLPFYIASPIIQKFLEAERQPEKMILMVQKEVAQRICAKPPRMSILAVSVQFYAEAKILFYVSKGSFSPPPKVDAACLKITPTLSWEKLRSSQFFKIVRAGFLHPRKQLAGNLSKELKIDKKRAEEWLKKNGINPKQRAETLSIEDWIKLTKILIF
ncbi:MAG: 16S rRNA (adenine(1518)-N(6)/adenine(1519)-N(6))-dimethyltransferase RsmA [bacterium]|nr:16S rRNA (adenine(1518)-N(6)/adenine(1519)-N(6))-dimethyltransferase RsmA [bacterium]